MTDERRQDRGEIAPCPLRWCQSRAVRVFKFKRPRGRSLFNVECQNCGCKTPQHRTSESALRQWNGEAGFMISGVRHWSDCAVHNTPAFPNEACNCGGYVEDRAMISAYEGEG